MKALGIIVAAVVVYLFFKSRRAAAAASQPTTEDQLLQLANSQGLIGPDGLPLVPITTMPAIHFGSLQSWSADDPNAPWNSTQDASWPDWLEKPLAPARPVGGSYARIATNTPYSFYSELN